MLKIEVGQVIWWLFTLLDFRCN